MTLFFALGAADAGHVPVLDSFRSEVRGDGIVLTFGVRPAPAYTVFTLKKPDRLVVDLPEVRWRLGKAALRGIRHVGAVRYGLFRRDRVRIVFDLKRPLRIRTARAGRDRLVISLAPTDRAGFDARAGAPEKSRWAGRAPPPPRAPKGTTVIAIDPGHGGIDPGARAGGMVEKILVLGFARRLAAELDATAGTTAYLVRTEDEFVPLAERIARAHRAGANAMISVHADSVASGEASGVSVYTLSEKATDEAANAFAARENRSDVIAGADLAGESDTLTRLLVELAQRGTRAESEKLAQAVLKSLSASVEVLRNRPYRRASFRVLKAPDMPSVLLELGFLDSAADRARLSDPVWIARAARAVAEGVAAWKKVASPGFLAPK